ncbi:MAG TPA: KH domain-containing protein [Vicinamibacterales bacterium]|nr:KH domain-containing protein [Vicinamibacterales bacterium]
MSRARDVVEVLARALTDNPGAVRVDEAEHRGTTVLELFVAPGDVGKVIGRQGRTAAALRTLVAATAEHEGRKVTLEIRDVPPVR